MQENYVPPSRRYIRIALFGLGAGAVILVFGICAAFSTVASKINLAGNESPTPVIVITGTIGVIAGMPIPPDGLILSQAVREVGGTFDYTTRLRPQDLYNFYVAILTQRSIWRVGRRPTITDSSGKFYFWPNIPRLTVITVDCKSDVCSVHVDY